LADEVRKVTEAFEKKKGPIYEKRDKLIAKIPGFWYVLVSLAFKMSLLR
jgi:hypothetical protein